ncbi:MAG: metal-dependent hydrolase [Candidatus Micrarchaeaceae archaeon]
MVKIKWLGHAAWLVEGSKNLIIDPFLSHNPKSAMKPNEIKKLDFIFITHNHFDHIGDSAELAKSTKAKIVTTFETAKMMQDAGVPEQQTIGMNKGSEPIDIGGVKVALTHAEHSGNEVGFIIELDGKRIYHAGDTALFGDMKYIGELYSPDVALLPIGGYFTMAPKEAAIAADLIGAKLTFPMHFNTFPQIEQDPSKFASMVKKSKVQILKPGEEYSL